MRRCGRCAGKLKNVVEGKKCVCFLWMPGNSGSCKCLHLASACVCVCVRVWAGVWLCVLANRKWWHCANKKQFTINIKFPQITLYFTWVAKQIVNHTQTYPHTHTYSCTTGEKKWRTTTTMERKQKKTATRWFYSTLSIRLVGHCLCSGWWGGGCGGVSKWRRGQVVCSLTYFKRSTLSLSHTPTLKFRNSQLFLLLAILLAVYALALPSLVPEAAQRKCGYRTRGLFVVPIINLRCLQSDKKLLYIYKR